MTVAGTVTPSLRIHLAMDVETERVLQEIWDAFAGDGFVYRGRDGEKHEYADRKQERED